MKIKTVQFIGAIGQPGQAPPAASAGLPQVAVAGRSNVGKSSLVNRVLGRTRTPVARVSGEPGKTQEINFYLVESDAGAFCLVDLPGYGFAKVPKALRERWRPLIQEYLSGSEALAGVVQLIDIRHGPTRDDLTSVGHLAELELPVLFVLTKADKLPVTRRAAAVEEIAARLGVGSEQVLGVSSRTGDGMDALLETIGGLVSAE